METSIQTSSNIIQASTSEPIKYMVSDFSDIIPNPSVHIYVRLRPLFEYPATVSKSLIGSFLNTNEENKKIIIKDTNITKTQLRECIFSFDRIYHTETTQKELFEQFVQSKVDKVLDGYNACCFAYGQTGSGKTHSMFGRMDPPKYRGMVPRAAEYIFDRLSASKSEVSVGCTFLEIYNEHIRDLAKHYDPADKTTGAEKKTSVLIQEFTKKRQSWMGCSDLNEFRQEFDHDVWEDASGRVNIKGLRTVTVASVMEILSLMEYGLSMRACHETEMNVTSSRSHVVFSIQVVQQLERDGELVTVSGILNLVDLAGSERLKDSKSEGSRKREAGYINSSLGNLAKVISDLDPTCNATHIPYRDCKLTRILQNSLSSNSYIAVLANINPHPDWYDETLSTLEFANRLHKVQCRPHVNRVASVEEMAHRWSGDVSKLVIESEESDEDVTPRKPTALPKSRLVYTHPRTLFSSFSRKLIVEIYENLQSDTLEVLAYSPDTREEFPHLFLRRMKSINLFVSNLQDMCEHYKNNSRLAATAIRARDSALGMQIVHRLKFNKITETPELIVEDDSERDADGCSVLVVSRPDVSADDSANIGDDGDPECLSNHLTESSESELTKHSAALCRGKPTSTNVTPVLPPLVVGGKTTSASTNENDCNSRSDCSSSSSSLNLLSPTREKNTLIPEASMLDRVEEKSLDGTLLKYMADKGFHILCKETSPPVDPPQNSPVDQHGDQGESAMQSSVRSCQKKVFARRKSYSDRHELEKHLRSIEGSTELCNMNLSVYVSGDDLPDITQAQPRDGSSNGHPQAKEFRDIPRPKFKTPNRRRKSYSDTPNSIPETKISFPKLVGEPSASRRGGYTGRRLFFN